MVIHTLIMFSLTLTLSKNCFCIDILRDGYIVNMLRAGFNKTSVRAMSADCIQRKNARTISLHRTCVVEKILFAAKNCDLRAHTFFELCMQNYVGTQLEVMTIKLYVYIYIYIYYI